MKWVEGKRLAISQPPKKEPTSAVGFMAKSSQVHKVNVSTHLHGVGTRKGEENFPNP